MPRGFPSDVSGMGVPAMPVARRSYRDWGSHWKRRRGDAGPEQRPGGEHGDVEAVDVQACGAGG
jgi:hypothetical protein